MWIVGKQSNAPKAHPAPSRRFKGVSGAKECDGSRLSLYIESILLGLAQYVLGTSQERNRCLAINQNVVVFPRRQSFLVVFYAHCLNFLSFLE